MKTPRGIFAGVDEAGDSDGASGVGFRRESLENASILFTVNPGFVGKSDGAGVGVARVVQIDAVMAAHLFHRLFERNRLGVEVARSMGSACQGAHDVRRRILGV